MMLAADISRGFKDSHFSRGIEPRVKKDEGGYYTYTLSENVKIYFNDFYAFLEKVEANVLHDLKATNEKLAAATEEQEELNAFLLAKKSIYEVTLKTTYTFYSESKNFGVVMTPWCFGTVVLEKVEAYRDRLSKGELADSKAFENSYQIVRYLDEITQKTLLDIFEFPETAFAMRWQYSELLKRYSKALTNITASLQSVMMLVKSYGS